MTTRSTPGETSRRMRVELNGLRPGVRVRDVELDAFARVTRITPLCMIVIQYEDPKIARLFGAERRCAPERLRLAPGAQSEEPRPVLETDPMVEAQIRALRFVNYLDPKTIDKIVEDLRQGRVKI